MRSNLILNIGAYSKKRTTEKLRRSPRSIQIDHIHMILLINFLILFNKKHFTSIQK